MAKVLRLHLLLLATLLWPATLVVAGGPTTFPTTGPTQTCHVFDYSATDFLTAPIGDLLQAEALSFAGLTSNDVPAVLARLKDLQKLTGLEFHNSDLSKMSANDPLPLSVQSVVVKNGKASQGTLRWLAKFPKGRELIFAGHDVRYLNMTVGQFAWLRFDHCKISRKTIRDTVGHFESVTFTEVTVSDEI